MKLDTEPLVKSPAPSAVFGFYFEIVADSQDVPKAVWGVLHAFLPASSMVTAT